jgi:hypothetical protein
MSGTRKTTMQLMTGKLGKTVGLDRHDSLDGELKLVRDVWTEVRVDDPNLAGCRISERVSMPHAGQWTECEDAGVERAGNTDEQSLPVGHRKSRHLGQQWTSRNRVLCVLEIK